MNMTVEQRRAAILEFARGRLPEGATIEDFPWYDWVSIRCGVFGSVSLIIHADDPRITISHDGINGYAVAQGRIFLRALTAAVALAEAIEAYVRGLAGEEEQTS